MSNLIDNFPEGFKPSDNQVLLLTRIQKAFESKKVVICCAPTGSGKSFISKTIGESSKKASAEYIELVNSYKAFRQDYAGEFTYEAEMNELPAHGTFVLTITKSLQDQYVDLFEDTNVLKGKSNYICDVDNNFDVETAPCVFIPRLREECWKDNRCPYYNSRNSTLVSQFATLNYSMFMALPDHVKKREYLVCDEASELDEELIKKFSSELYYSKLDFYGIKYTPLVVDDYNKTRTWIEEVDASVQDKINQMLDTFSNKQNKMTPADKTKLSFLKNLHISLSTSLSLWNTCEFVIDRDTGRVLITPLRANNLAKYIFNYGDKILLMSATIIDHKNFAQQLGITDYEYIEVGSEFDPKRSPIYVSGKYKINYQNMNKVMPLICEQIKEIVKQHKEDKGIIHTHSFNITSIIQKKLEKTSDRYLFRDEETTNEEILNYHKESDEPTVLVSPSLSYGVDLKDDLARFQVICKLPYLPLSSKRIKRLFEIDKDWYEDKMLNTLVQASGRATRSLKDHSITYILDGNVINVLKRAKSKLPKHFLDRVM